MLYVCVRDVVMVVVMMWWGPLTNHTVPWWGYGGENGRAAPVNRTDAHGRLFSDLTNFKDVYAKPARRRGRG